MPYSTMLVTTRFEESNYQAKWEILNFGMFKLELQNGSYMESPGMKIFYHGECFFRIYPHGKGEQDRNFISVNVHFSGEHLYMKTRRISFELLSNGVRVAKATKSHPFLIDKIGILQFDNLVNSTNIRQVTISCHINGHTRVDSIPQVDI